jgi:hypothetical protein
VNDEIVINIAEDCGAPYRFHGKFREEDEDTITILGTVGEDIDDEIIIPKRNIHHIKVTQRVPELRRSYDEHWDDTGEFGRKIK